ncbi:MAG: hypothetical protein ACF787_12340, partial [Rhodopirellula sp. JB053]
PLAITLPPAAPVSELTQGSLPSGEPLPSAELSQLEVVETSDSYCLAVFDDDGVGEHGHAGSETIDFLVASELDEMPSDHSEGAGQAIHWCEQRKLEGNLDDDDDRLQVIDDFFGRLV